MPTETHSGAVLLRPLVDRMAAVTMGQVEARDGGVWLDDRAAVDLIAGLNEVAERRQSALDEMYEAADEIESAVSGGQSSIGEIESAIATAQALLAKVTEARKAAAA